MRRFAALVLAVFLTTSQALSAGLFGGFLPAMYLTGTPVTNANLGNTIAPWTVAAFNAAPTVTFSVISGAFPTGVSLNSTTGVVSGSPASAGDFPVTIGAEDSSYPGGHRVAQLPAFTMSVHSPGNAFLISSTPSPTTTGVVGVVATSFTISASGGTGPYTYSVFSGYLPPGITLSSSTGVMSGTYTEDGTYTRIVIRATDSLGATSNLASFDWVVQQNGATVVSLTSSTPVPYVRLNNLVSGTVYSMHGITIVERASADSYDSGVVNVDVDSDGNYMGSEWYSPSIDWPPGSLVGNYSAPFTIAEVTNYPWRITSSNPGTLRGGRVAGTISSQVGQTQLTLYPLSSASGNPSITTPGASPACYYAVSTHGPTWSNINATGTLGQSTLHITSSAVTSDSLYVGEVVQNPRTDNLQPSGGAGFDANTTVASITGTYDITLSKPLLSNVTKATFAGCTGFYRNSAGILSDKPGTSNYYKVREDHVWDGIRTCATNQACTNNLTQMWITYARDDAIENDNNYTIVVNNTLIDNAFAAVSASGSGASHSATDMMTFNGSILHVSGIPSEYSPTPPTGYGVPFKVTSIAPSITLHDTIIAVDGANDQLAGRYTDAWTLMTNGYGSCVDSTPNPITGLTGNYFLWLGDDAPHGIGTIPPGCFTQQQGATARATYAAALAAMQTYLGQHGLYRLSSDP